MSAVLAATEDREDKRAAPTSAIIDLSVAEVRKSLALIRKKWDAAKSDPTAPPLYPSEEIGTGVATVESFALKFVVGHHTRRQAKSTGGGATQAGDAEL
jgi:hypothetical protein